MSTARKTRQWNRDLLRAFEVAYELAYRRGYCQGFHMRVEPDRDPKTPGRKPAQIWEVHPEFKN